ncbi:aspartate-semialdehyde dehydrogenase [Auriscalpium vulgare]|uniref:Aspartate-semialdehyde dehydrogenase n=1 Tax=Auriscalpium vulgare TaxID=40419 RepID=A0ACB8RRR6_9AGAM|nr:aspartate-semialdehyde dehydrogenase [Auriscalpium vulgare]
MSFAGILGRDFVGALGFPTPQSSSVPPGFLPTDSQSPFLHDMHGIHQGELVNIGVLGATGTVGQRFIALLESHPYFVVHALGASARSAGKAYSKAVNWKQTTPIPASVRDLPVHACEPEHFRECVVVFSGLDADVAGDIEAAFRAADLAVFSNAKSYRRDPHVPLIVPLVNTSHLSIIPQQRSLHTPPLRKGFIVTNANCSTTGVVIPLAALERAFGPVESCLITTMQAVSGAGYPGVPSLDIFDNIVPYIPGEEEKMEWETLKILGGIGESDAGAQAFDMHAGTPLRISASCTRVPVIEGHTETVSVRFARRPPPSPQQVREALLAYTPEAQTLGCPSAPRHAIYVHEEDDRPQPRLDRNYQQGAGVSVGRVRQCRVLDVKFVVLVNNVNIGAATSSIINAEVAIAKGVITL